MVGATQQETEILFIWKNYEQNDKFGKGWSQSSELMTGTNIYSLPTPKKDLS